MNNLEYTKIINSKQAIIIQFGADSCNPCKALKLRIEDYLKAKDNIAYYYIDVPSNLDFCAQLTVMSVPSIKVYLEGQLVIEKAGYFSLDEIIERLEGYLAILNA